VTTEWTAATDDAADADESDQITVLDVVAGATVVLVAGIADLGRRGTRRAAGLAERLPPPPPLPTAARRRLDDLATRGREQQIIIVRTTTAWLDVVIPRIVEAILSRVDLTSMIKRNLDIDAIIADVDLDAAARNIDVDAIIARVDLVTLVKEVMNAIDISEIIRESTATVASDNVREVRMQSIAGDEAVRRVVERLTRRRRRPSSTAADGTTPGQGATTESIVVEHDDTEPSAQP
jgi:hypothetical protein